MNDETAQTPTPPPKPKARRGRPPNAAKPAARVPLHPAPTKASPRYKMKAKPNWDDLDDLPVDDSPDRLRISPDLIPEGMDALWVTESIYGQPQPQRRAEFEKRGWTPVHQEDFDGQFDGMWMAKGAPGEIKVDGLVLMMRPLELTKKAKRVERVKALERVQIKERELRGGNIPGVTLDSAHPNAVRSNKMNRSLDGAFVPMRVPED